MKKGFTLVEVLVVMAIVAVLLSLGITGLLQFRSSTEVKEGEKQLIGTFDLIRNAAKNDVRPDIGVDSINFKGYKFTFADKRIEYCIEDRVGTTVREEWACQFDESIQETFFNISFPIYYGKGGDFENPDGIEECTSVYFESLTGDISVDFSGTITTTGKCFVAITSFSKTITGYVYIDALTDTYLTLPNLEQTTRFN